MLPLTSEHTARIQIDTPRKAAFVNDPAPIEQWLKNKDTYLFLGVWERLNNPDSNSLEFDGVRNLQGGAL